MKKNLLIIASIFLISSCGARVAVRRGYDFSSVKRVGVLKFDSSRVNYFQPHDPGNAIADEFVFQLLDKGINVVERSRIEKVISEQKLWKSGYIDPETVKKAGKILGVDALILGTVTRYVPDKKKRVYMKGESGSLSEEIFYTEAEIGISARMIDVQTAEVLWAGTYEYESFYVGSAIKQAVGGIIDSLNSSWFSERRSETG